MLLTAMNATIVDIQEAKMNDGFYFMKDEDYFSFSALSNSFLKAFDRSPAHAYYQTEETSFMKLGKFGHAFLLSPMEFKKLIIAPPECKNRKNIPYPEFAKLYAGNTQNIILSDEFNALKEVKKRLLEYNMMPGLNFGSIYEKCKKEMAVFYFDPEFEILLKGKLDLFFWNKELPMIFDPKFTTNSKDLERKILDRNLKYYRQAAFYTDLVFNITGVMPIFYFIGIENKEPYGIDFFELTDDLLEAGRVENLLSIRKYLDWVESGSIMKSSWEGVNRVLKPNWMKF